MVILMARTRVMFMFVMMLLASTIASAQATVNLAWDASADPNVAGYTVKWGTRAQTYTSTVDVGNRTGWTVSGLVPDQKYFFVVTSYASNGISSGPSNEVSNDALIVKTATALTDQRPTLFWHNGVTGQLQTWLLYGTNVLDTRPISMGGVSDTNWKVAGTGDLNGDGFSDILWRNGVDGSLAAWFLQNNQVIATNYLSINKMADVNWQIKGLGDIDGDKCADIIWQHTDGSLAAWIMRGTQVTSTRFLSIPNVGDTAWQIAAVADTNGDGLADLIWQVPTQGWLAVWYLQGTNVVGTLYLSINKMPDINWRIQTAGYINGLGPAIVWRHLTEGWVALWTLQGNLVTGTYFLNPNKVDDQNWKIVGR
jgi:hypothetical protein